ncbi:MAG TPA: GYD domain-containing protein [Miltoncostaeaceae bacterium]|jgi:uncharacterized protein with GYD domain|nr:GYD domain-containing protein [Miltoncostaeaceae bacterium]
MRTFILLSTLTPQGLSNLRRTPERLLEVNREVEAYGGRVVRQWALLGPYDFLTVITAPDERAVARIASDLSARGSAHFETLPAIPRDEFIAEMAGDGPPAG